MSGHSHWKTIQRVKQNQDKRRGEIFSKISRVISVAARQGADPATNPKLRQALDEAKSLGVPKDNIERAIKKGAGGGETEKLEEITLEAFGPGGIAMIIEGITDNKNRTLSEIKQVLQKHQGKLADTGSVKWLFERKGCLTVDFKSLAEDLKNKDGLELKAIEAGAEDTYWHKTEDLLDVYTKPEELEKVKKKLQGQGIKVESASLDWVAKEEIAPSAEDKERCQKLFEDLDENEAVQDIYSNLKA